MPMYYVSAETKRRAKQILSEHYNSPEIVDRLIAQSLNGAFHTEDDTAAWVEDAMPNEIARAIMQADGEAHMATAKWKAIKQRKTKRKRRKLAKRAQQYYQETLFALLDNALCAVRKNPVRSVQEKERDRLRDQLQAASTIWDVMIGTPTAEQMASAIVSLDIKGVWMLTTVDEATLNIKFNDDATIDDISSLLTVAQHISLMPNNTLRLTW